MLNFLYSALWLFLIFPGGLLLWPFVRLFNPTLGDWFIHRIWPLPLQTPPELWIHAVSVGELKLANTILKALPYDLAEQTLVTTSTPAGILELLKVRSNTKARLLPFDLSWCYRRLFGPKGPPDLVLIETELWPNLLHYVAGHNRQIMIINGRLSSKTMRWRWLPLLRKMIGDITLVHARSQEDGQNFQALGMPADRITVTGNLKFDYAQAKRLQGPFAQWMIHSDSLVIFASVATEEVRILAPSVLALLERDPQLHILWAPRQLADTSTHLKALQKAEPTLRSSLEPNRRLVVLDTMGELAGCYLHANLSFVGGTFNQRGGQNFLESLQAGTPVLIGPYYENFAYEVAEAQKAACIQVCSTPQELVTHILDLLAHPQRCRTMSESAASFMAANKGALEKAVAAILATIASPKTKDNT